jgi:hypothetical protein
MGSYQIDGMVANRYPNLTGHGINIVVFMSMWLT